MCVCVCVGGGGGGGGGRNRDRVVSNRQYTLQLGQLSIPSGNHVRAKQPQNHRVVHANVHVVVPRVSHNTPLRTEHCGLETHLIWYKKCKTHGSLMTLSTGSCSERTYVRESWESSPHVDNDVDNGAPMSFHP